MNMLAARLYGKHNLRIEEMPVPMIGDDEILLRVKVATICGTDLRMVLNGTNGANAENPLVLCHEFAGVIEKVGSRVIGYQPGERVSVAPNMGCGVCNLCVAGKSHHCKKIIAIGVHMDGGFAQFVKIPAKAVHLGNVTPLPDSVSFAAGAANEAFSCVYNAFERYGIVPGDTVVIIGAGAIGLMHAKLAKMAGAAKIIVNDSSEDRLVACAALEPSIIPISDCLLEKVMEETKGNGADVVITACSAAAAQQIALTLAGLDGRVNFFGGLPKGKEQVELDTNIIHYKQLTVSGTTRASLDHYRKTLYFIESGLVDLDSLVTHNFSIHDIDKAFKNAMEGVGLKQAIIF
jgi:L-iditol 2-dehydrogenase